MGVANEVTASGEMDLALVGALLADRSRARVLLALADGRSLAASVLAVEAGVSPATMSHHLARLLEAGFVSADRRGRHRYFRLSGPRVGELIEAAARVAPTQPITSLRQGTRAYAVRYARRCYDHLAGRLGVAVTDALCEQGILTEQGGVEGAEHYAGAGDVEGFAVTAHGQKALGELGITASAGQVVRGCLDWTEQRPHIAGPLGRAVMNRMLELEWLTRDAKTRAVRLTDRGRRDLPAQLGVELPAA